MVRVSRKIRKLIIDAELCSAEDWTSARETGLPVVDALRRFRAGRKHLAIVRVDGGPMLGVCTLEDVLEEIVGEIEDEFDRPTPEGSR